MRPERCRPLAVGVLWWTGAPRPRCGRGGEPELRHRRVVPGGWSGLAGGVARTQSSVGCGVLPADA